MSYLVFVDAHPWLSFFAGAGVFMLVVLVLLFAGDVVEHVCNSWVEVRRLQAGKHPTEPKAVEERKS